MNYNVIQCNVTQWIIIKHFLKLSSEWLCRAIAWDAIDLGGNKQGGKLSGDNYVMWGPLSEGNFPGGNYLGVIISIHLFCGTIVWEPIVQGLTIRGQLPGKQFIGMQLSGGNYP